uniref:Protein shisa-5 n=1 Tax=Macrostomum lignano TaxID=282301 RepID=A0A1I8HRY9_9PLAT
MRLTWLVAGVLLAAVLLMATSADAARSRARFSYRSRARFSYRSRARFSYRSRTRFRYSRSRRYSRYSYIGPIYSRRLSPSLMGPVYFGYASRYPMYFNYRRGSSAHGFGEVCTNHLALSNGSYAGTFHCPFLPDEPRSWTKCCGFDGEGFCCDPDYNDSWKLAVGLGAAAILAIIGGVLLALGLLIALLVYCCCCSKKRGGSGGAGASAAAAGSSKEPVGVTNPVKPPYPTMEYGTATAISAPVLGSELAGGEERVGERPEKTAELVWTCR